jgi:hypothetical protein
MSIWIHILFKEADEAEELPGVIPGDWPFAAVAENLVRGGLRRGRRNALQNKREQKYKKYR